MSRVRESHAVMLDYPALAPPHDPIRMLKPDGWLHFHTSHADAWVAYDDAAGSDFFLLHWLESRLTGHGGLVLDAIGEWADERWLEGRLLCACDLAGFYRKHGWSIVEQFPYGPPSVSMMRLPVHRPSAFGRPVVDVESERV